MRFAKCGQNLETPILAKSNAAMTVPCGVVGNGAGVDHSAPRSGQWIKDHPHSIATTVKSVPDAGQLDEVDLSEWFGTRVSMLKRLPLLPPQGQASGRHACRRACVEVVRDDTDDDVIAQELWGLFAKMSWRNGLTILHEESGQKDKQQRNWKRQLGEVARV